MFRHLKHLDWVIIISVLLLVAVGLLSLYSSSLGRGDFTNFKKQLIFAGVGFFLMLIFSHFDYRVLKNDPHLILLLYSLCILALGGIFFFAPEIRHVKSWYKIGSFSFDPIEFTKIILLILLAKYFSMRHVEMYRIHHIFFSGLYILVPGILIFLQPNLGSLLIVMALWLAVIFISGIKIRQFIFLIFLGILASILSWQFLLKDYQKERVLDFVMPAADPLGISWSKTQARIAVGSGGFFGQGLGKGSQTQYGFLPEPQTDFIFSAIAEEFGLAGISILLFLFSFLIYRIIKIAIDSQANFSRFFATGLGVIIIAPIFINIGMNLGLLPIIGLSLPLVSYGGSSMIALFIGLGILQNIRLNQ